MCAKHATYAGEEGYSYIIFITGLLAWFTDWGSDVYPGEEIMTVRIRMCLNDAMWALQGLGKWLWKRHIPYPFVNNTVRISWWMCHRKFFTLQLPFFNPPFNNLSYANFDLGSVINHKVHHLMDGFIFIWNLSIGCQLPVWNYEMGLAIYPLISWPDHRDTDLIVSSSAARR